MQIGGDDVAGAHSLAAVATVVAEPAAHAPQGSGLAEKGAAAVVFETDEKMDGLAAGLAGAVAGAAGALAGGVVTAGGAAAGELAEAGDVGHDVTDQAPFARLGGKGLQVEQAEAGQLAAVGGHVAAPQELQPGADGEHDGAVGDHAGDPGAQPGEIGGQRLLNAVLAAAHEDEVAARRRLVAALDRVPVQGKAAQRGAAGQRGDVAAVAVGVHRRRIEVDRLEDGGRQCVSPRRPPVIAGPPSSPRARRGPL